MCRLQARAPQLCVSRTFSLSNGLQDACATSTTSLFSSRFFELMTMADRHHPPTSFGWSHADTRRRQIRAGVRMTPAERLAWLEEMLDELLPLVGRARAVERKREKTSD